MNTIFYLIIALLVLVFLSSCMAENFSNDDDDLDAVIYLNLENRPDRKALIIEELERANIDPKKVHKISSVYIPKNGHKGCVQSHIMALELASLNGWNRVLILEDDATISEPILFKMRLRTLLKTLDEKKWDVLLLGACVKEYDEEYTPVNVDGNSIQKVNAATCGHAYIINGQRYRDKLLSLFKDCNNNMSPEMMNLVNHEPHALDQRWKDFQRRDKWFCLENDIVSQRNIWSTTQNNIYYN